MKVIITTGLRDELKRLLTTQDDENNRYLRLLPFTEEQTKEFFDIYGGKLTYDSALKLGFRKEELSRPQFAWMLSSIYSPAS